MSVVAGRALPAAVPATWLRVYEPLEAFPRGERAHWAAYALRASAGARADEVEQRASWTRLVSRAAATGEATAPGDASVLVDERRGGPLEARVLRMGGVPLLCPVPAGERALVRPWEMPVAWFLLVRAEDRPADGAPGRYLAPMSRCRVRAARALKTLRRALGDAPVTAEVADASRWIEGFHPRSWVELDSRSVTALVHDDAVDDVQMGLDALAEGDASGVAAAYQRIGRRDEILREISRSS